MRHKAYFIIASVLIVLGGLFFMFAWTAPPPPMKLWRIEAISPHGEVTETRIIERRHRPYVDYSDWNGQGRVWDSGIRVPSGWMIRVTEEKE